MKAADIARRARAELGTPYRLHGRLPGRALDCIGLVAVAVGPLVPADIIIPATYALRGYYELEIRGFFGRCGFDMPPCADALREGDVIAVQPGPGQWHLMVEDGLGLVHADAGLRRVTYVPGCSPWPVVAIFRHKEG